MGDQSARTDGPGATEGEHLDGILSTTNVLSFRKLLLYGIAYLLVMAITHYHGIVFFAGFSPPWRCSKSAASSFCQFNHNKTFALDADMFGERCNLTRTEWTYVTNEHYSFVTEYDLVCGRGPTAALIGAAFYCGCVVGAFLGGPVADAYGRKTAISLFLLTMIASGISLRFSNKLWQLYPLQFVGGISLSGAYYPNWVYLAEMTPPKHRGNVLNMACVFSSLSFMMMDLTAYFLESWRLLYLYLTLAVLPFVFVFLLLPESPRWLLMKNRYGEAEKSLRWLTSCSHVKLQRSNTNTSNSDKKTHTYWDLVRSRKVLIFTLRIAFLWAVAPILYYTIAAQSLNYGGSMYVNYLLASLADIPGVFLAAFLTACIGRKKTTLAGVFGSTVLTGVIPIVPKEFVYRHTILLVLTVIARCCCYTAFISMYLWTPELFPTVVRAQGQAICGVFEKLAMIGIPFVLTVLNAISYSLPFVLMSALGVLGCLAVWPLPETLHQPTRETFEDFFMNSNANVDEIGLDNLTSE